MLDLAIVGAGPCGLACAAAAQRAGLDYACFDKGAIADAIARFPVGLRFFSTAERLAIAGVPFVAPEPHPTREQVLAYYRGVVHALGLRVETFTEVAAVERAAGGFRLLLRPARAPGPDREVRAAAVVIATGYFDHPNRLGVPGEDLPHVSHYFREPHACYGRDVVVVGGRNSAVEASIELARAGARVTLVHRGPELSDRVKPWLLPFFRSLERQGAIAAVFGAVVEAVEPTAVRVRRDGGVVRVPADFVFLLTGFRPDHALARSLGVTVDPATGAPVHDPETMETDVAGVFVCGVAAAGYDANRIFIENGRFHGERVVRRLLRARGVSEAEIEERLRAPVPWGGEIGRSGEAEPVV